MSFRNPFKTHPKKSVIAITAEREFEREVKKLEQLDDNAKKLYKDMKRCLESQTAQSKSEVKVAQDLMNSPLGKDDALLNMAENWCQSTQHLEALMMDLNASSQKTVMEPMKKFGTVFPSLQNAIKKREQLLQDYNKSQAKLEKYLERDRTGSNIVKRESTRKMYNAAKEEFDSQNNALMEDMPKFYDGRIDYIQPSFQALIKSQVKYYTDCHKTYSDMAEKMQGHTGDDGQHIQQKLAEIRALSITVDE